MPTPRASSSSMSPPPPRGPDLRGVVLDRRYRLGAVLGSGGGGNVYAAEDRRLRRSVAIKVFHPELARTPEQRRRIRLEAQVGARLDHPNIAPILDFGEDPRAFVEPLTYLVMPRLEGRTLREVVLSSATPWHRACVWARQLLAGLAALHAEGVQSRDIKPEKCILVGEGPREVLRLLDLGLAEVSGPALISQHLQTTHGRMVGTLPYIAPEQALGEPLDPRCDLYAVGVVLFELLTRRPPFVGSDYEILVGHVERPPPSASTVTPHAGIPAELEEVLALALAKRPADRFASAAAFDAALVQILRRAGEDIEASPAFAGASEARRSLAAWTSFEYRRAREQADAAARLDLAWSPLKLLMSLLPEE